MNLNRLISWGGKIKDIFNSKVSKLGVGGKVVTILGCLSVGGIVSEKSGITNLVPESKESLTMSINDLSRFNFESMKEVQEILKAQLKTNGDNWDTRRDIEEILKQLENFEKVFKDFKETKLPQESNERLAYLIAKIPFSIDDKKELGELRKKIEEELEKQKEYLDDNLMNGNSSIRDRVESNIDFTWSIDDFFYNKFFDIFTIEYINFMGEKGYSIEDLQKSKKKGLDITPYELRTIVHKCAKSITDNTISKKNIKVKLTNGEIEISLTNLKYVHAVSILSKYDISQKNGRVLYVENNGENFIIELDGNLTIISPQDNNITLTLLKDGKEISSENIEQAKNGANTEFKVVIGGKEYTVIAQGYKNSQGKSFYQIPGSCYTGEEAEKIRKLGLDYLIDLTLQAQCELENKGLQYINDSHLINSIIISIIEHIDGDRELKDEELKRQINEVLYILGANGANSYENGNSSVASGLTQFTKIPYNNLRKIYPKAGLIGNFEIGTKNHVNIMEATLLYLDDTYKRIKKIGIFTTEQDLHNAVASDYNGGPLHARNAKEKHGGKWWKNIENNENRLYVNKYERVKQLLREILEKKIKERKKNYENWERGSYKHKKTTTSKKHTPNIDIYSGKRFITPEEIRKLKINYPRLTGTQASKNNENKRITALLKAGKISHLTDKNIDRLIREGKLVKIKDSDYYKINGPQVHESRRYLTPNIKKILETIAKEFYKKFKKPLIINSLARTQEYQNTLNKSNKNATKSISAHTYGIAFDIKIKEYLTLEEANYICYILLKMEEEGKINGIIEGGATMCFHITDLL